MKFQTKEAVNNVVWVILFLLLVPSSFAVASWNSLPGSGLFRIKLAMESVLVALAPTEETKGSLGVMFTERRVNEATKLLADRGSSEGLSYLNAQILASKERIQKTNNATVQAKLAQEYITTLQNANVQLEQQKQLLAASATPSAPTPTATRVRVSPSSPPLRSPAPTRLATSPMATPTVTPAISPPDPVEQIEETQEEIQEAIEELQQAATLAPASSQPAPTEIIRDARTIESAPSPTAPPPALIESDDNSADHGRRGNRDGNGNGNNNGNGNGGNGSGRNEENEGNSSD